MSEFRKEIMGLSPYVPGKPIEAVKKEFGLERVVKLASNENPYGCSPKAREAAVSALAAPEYYPDGSCAELRAAVAEKYGVAENQIVFGCGTDEVISMISKVFVNLDDEIVTGDRTFSQYMASAVSMGGRMVYVPMDEGNGFDLEGMLAAITDRTRLIFFANPNNPTGTLITNAEQIEFIRRVPENIIIVIDEAYREFVDADDFPDTLGHLAEHKNVMLLKTFSKAYGLASLRVGFGIASPEIIAMFEKIRNPFNVSIPGQAAAIKALEDQEFVQRTKEGNIAVRAFVYEKCEELGLSYIPTQANFVMIKTPKSSGELFVALMKRGFIIRAGAAFGMDEYIRVTLGTMGQMCEFMDVLEDTLKR